MPHAKNINQDKKVSVSGVKAPKSTENPELYYNWSPSWNFSKCDFSHDNWSLCATDDIYNEIIMKLVSFESKLRKNIIIDEKSHNHWIDCSNLCKSAQKRIIENKWEYDRLFSLRLSGKLRLFGNIEHGIFYIVWYDKNHEICPCVKKHT